MVGELGFGGHILAGTLGGLTILLLVWRRSAVRSTTLVIPWWWSVVSTGAIALAELWIGWRAGGSSDWAGPLRFTAAATLFCPVMAIMGAKRPQDKAWQLIVVSLWVVVALPGLQHLILHPNQPLVVRGAPSWFVAGLIGVSLINFLPTRFWPSAILVGCAQWILISAFLPVPQWIAEELAPVIGLACLFCAVVLPALGLPRSRPALQPEDRLWIDFRNCFGLLWGLRVAERINAAAEMYDWNVRLTWFGFRRTNTDGEQSLEPIPSEIAPTLHRTTRNLLRRFVSREWMTSRLAKQSEETHVSRDA